MDTDFFLRHRETQRAVNIALGVNPVAVGILDVDALHPACQPGHRDGLATACSRNAILPAGTVHGGAFSLGGESEVIGIFDGFAIHVIAGGVIELALRE